MLSCNLGKFDIIKKLLSQEDIQVNTQENYTGYTALMIVLDSNMLDANQKEEIVKLLVDKSANLNIKDEQYGLTSTDRTNENELLNIKKILTVKGGLSSEELDKE
jgi:ankyrin repeat protein